jgi:hypothetical protein
MILGFHLVFYIFLPDFLFFLKFSNLNSKIDEFLIRSGLNPPNFRKFGRIC